jgi:hypothetical protein
MKRLLASVAILFVVFAGGMYLGAFLLWRATPHEHPDLHDLMKSVPGQLYGRNYFHLPTEELHKYYPQIESQLSSFDPSTSTGSISFAHVRGKPLTDVRLRLYGNGELYSETQGKSRLITKVTPETCKESFHRILTSGILNCSEGIVEMKAELIQRQAHDVTPAYRYELSVNVPELDAETRIAITTPDVSAENFPEIIELTVFLKCRDQILSLLPNADYPWYSPFDAERLLQK